MDQRESFNQFCKERFLDKCINSKTVSKEKVIKFLNGELSSTQYDPVFKNWISRKGLKLVDYPPLSLKDVVCLPAKEKVSMFKIFFFHVHIYKYVSAESQPFCQSGGEWPLLKISLMFSQRCTARKRGI